MIKKSVLLKKPTVRNPVARDLLSGKYSSRVVRSRKGKGSYQRNEKWSHRNADSS